MPTTTRVTFDQKHNFVGMDRPPRPRKVVGRVSRCVECENVVEWPVALGDDGVCLESLKEIGT